MARCCASRDARFMLASPKRLKTNSRKLPRTSPSCCRVTGLTEKAASLWGKAGPRSLQRSALVEAIEQFKRALAQIALLPSTPALRRMQINLQVALITPLFHVRGYGGLETKASLEQARLLLEQADVLGETPEDPLLLYSVLFGFFVANFNTFNDDVCRDLGTQFLELAEKQRASYPLVVGHNILGAALLLRGDIAEARAHFDQGIALYDPSQHRLLATRFGEDHGVVSFCWRASALWLIGYPETARADIDQAFKNARESGHAVSLIWAFNFACSIEILCGNYTTANARVDELIALTDEKDAAWWRTIGMLNRGRLLGLTGRAADAIQLISSGLITWRSLGSIWLNPTWLSAWASAEAELGQFDDAWRCIDEAMMAIKTTGERWFEAEVNRLAGEIALKSPQHEVTKAQAYFERALTIARQQQAKSWELRAAMSMARLWRDQGKRDEARDLLAPVYGWFTEGFDTVDLKEAKALLEELAA
jgi:predicted ATPase